MWDILRTGLAFAVDLGVLIFVHELGHYLAARSQGVTVEVFSIGFGPALLKWTARSGTVWQVSALPLGGYVRMQGWGGQDDKTLKTPGSFAAAPLASRAVIVAAGPLANLVLAFVLFAGLYMTVGRVVTQPVLSEILPNSPAAAAHLQPGDRVLDIGGTKVGDFGTLQSIIVENPDTVLDFTIQRGTAVFTTPVQLGEVSADGETAGRLGVVGKDSAVQRFTPPAAIAAAAGETAAQIRGWVGMLGQLVVHHQGLSDLAGPLGILQITGQAAALGIIAFVNLVAIISINLGLANLIPIPILDGGYLVAYALEAVLRRPLSAAVREAALRFGALLILTLVLFVTFNDLTRLGAIAWLTHLL
ncbi:RIP metalloprotease RseP [Acidocella sp. KAb 2-4]|uniref:RIP metalloprotease RseP n=1 Tax=Acidocella sp. KAb 2-4 TaxID=2885158 RepID=UPI001D07B3E2|nr:RIP metalloprotease RseP [Acidocella sp. KAb 2-4]MCB5943176.1 RIP metalloprotease RseP [Acidocella sp. KAb 2-4]